MRFGCELPPDQLDADHPPRQRYGRKLHVGPGGFLSFRCPRRWAHEPFAAEAWDCYRWWEQGQLGHRSELPVILVAAIDELDRAIGAARAVYYRRKRNEDR